MASRSNKMDSQCIFFVAVRAGPPWSKFSVEIAWQRRTSYLATSFASPYNTRYFHLGYAEDTVYVPPLQPTTHAATWCHDESYSGYSWTRSLYKHDGYRAAHGALTAYPYKCRSTELQHMAYQIGLWFPFLCLLLLQPHYTDMVCFSRVHPVPWLLYVIRRTGPRHVDAPNSVIIRSPLKPRFFKLFLPRRGLANLFWQRVRKMRIIFR